MKIKINLIIQSLITTIVMEVLKRLDSNTFLKSLVNSSTNAITYSTMPFHHGRKKNYMDHGPQVNVFNILCKFIFTIKREKG